MTGHSPNSAGANADYAWQFSLRVFGWRESPAAGLLFRRQHGALMRFHTFIFAVAVVLIYGCTTEHRIGGQGDVGRWRHSRALGFYVKQTRD